MEARDWFCSRCGYGEGTSPDVPDLVHEHDGTRQPLTLSTREQWTITRATWLEAQKQARRTP